jgi:YidC/Oxa1 family membrane protein insertase
MQVKNLLLFIAFCILVIAGWPLLERQIWGPRDKDESKKTEEAKKDKPKKKPKKAKKKEAAKKPAKKKKVAQAPRPRRPLKPHLFTLGEDAEAYHLRVVFTDIGAGVRSVTLTKFEGADADGRGTGELLALVPDDPLLPSNLLYHYPLKNKKKPKDGLGDRPSAALGDMRWTVVSRDAQKRPGVATDGDGVQSITFQTKMTGRFRGIRVLKTFRLAPKEYHVHLRVEVKDDRPKGGGGQAREFRYQLTGAHGLPIEGKWYTSTYRNAMVCTVDHKGNPERAIEESRKVSLHDGGNMVPEEGVKDSPIQYAGVATQFFAAMIVVDNTGTSRKDVPPFVLEWARPTLESKQVKGRVTRLRIGADWVGFTLVEPDAEKTSHDFAMSADSELARLVKPREDLVVTYRPGESPNAVLGIQPGDVTPKPQFDDITVRVNSFLFRLKPGESRVDEFLLYHGPVKVRLLGYFSGENAVSGQLVERYNHDLHLNTLTDYHSDSWIGSFSSAIHWTDLLILCTNLMHWLLWVLHKVVPIYGLNIILLTVLVRGLMFPISRKQAYLSMRMQELAPEMKKVAEKYKNDPQARTQATMELYRKHGVNPFAGCLPLLLQMPIFLGLYYALQESIFFRLEPFLWIDNLTAPDMLIYWGPHIPWISDPNNLGSFGYLGPYFNLLPMLAVTLMIVQQKLMTPPPTDENQAFQQKLMKFMMVFMGLIFYKVAAGLCIYFIASSLWGVAERKLLPKRKPGAAGPAGPSSPARPTGKGARKPPKPDGDKPFQKVRDWWAEVLKQAKKK